MAERMDDSLLQRLDNMEKAIESLVKRNRIMAEDMIKLGTRSNTNSECWSILDRKVDLLDPGVIRCLVETNEVLSMRIEELEKELYGDA